MAWAQVSGGGQEERSAAALRFMHAAPLFQADAAINRYTSVSQLFAHDIQVVAWSSKKYQERNLHTTIPVYIAGACFMCAYA